MVGAGWAGLSAASALERAGRRVVVFEQSPLLGGRARNAVWQPRAPLPLDESIAVDNGQHLLMGAYTQTLDLIKSLTTEQHFNELFSCSPIALRDANGFSLSAHARLAAPLHLAWALSLAKGLPFAERLALIRLMAWLQLRRWRVQKPMQTAMTVEQLMVATKQPESLRTKLWYPLCISALNTPAATASAQVFANVLKDTLGASRSASDFVVARASLGETLPKLVADQLAGNTQCATYTSERVVSITMGSDSSAVPSNFQVKTEQRSVAVQGVVLASPWATTGKLLQGAGLSVPSADTLTQLPICTVYLYSKQSDRAFRQEPLMLNENLNAQHFGHWLFDLGQTRGGGHLRSIVISGPGPHQTLSRQQIGDAVQQQLRAQVGFDELTEHFVITEKSATFACTAGLQRPKPITNHPRVKLCGDYYDSPYPATLETAVRSGLKAAADLLTPAAAELLA